MKGQRVEGWVGFIRVVTLVALGSVSARAANTFTAVSGGDWNEAANWSLGHVPADGEDVVVNGNVLLTNATAALASYTLNAGKTHTFNGWGTVLSASVVTVSGTMTHTNNLATNAVDGVWVPNARVWIACSNLTVGTGGKIDVSNKGYGVGLWYCPGYGPGGAPYQNSASNGLPSYGHGGAYGGIGGGLDGTYGGRYTNLFDAAVREGPVYGLANQPTEPGSGGGGGDNTSQSRKGSGGGVVRVEASGTVTVNGGGVLANGEAGGYHMGSGSGGSVWITCRVLAGSGPIQANGGSNQGGGGGGRIAVVYDPDAQVNVALPSAVFSASGGKGGNLIGVPDAGLYPDGDLGTLWFPDSQILTRQGGVVLHSGRWLATLPVWERDTLEMSNAWLRFADGFRLVVTNGLTVSGTDNRLHKLEVTSGTITVGGDVRVEKASVVLRASETVGPELHVVGGLTLTNAAALSIYSAMTASPQDYGALVSVTGNVRIADASWVYPYSHPTNGGAPLFVMNNLNIQTNAGFDASARGCWGGLFKESGYGLGAGRSDGSGGGGGHGGIGGFYKVAGNYWGTTNDLCLAPFESGSGGGGGGRSDMVAHSAGGSGGGVVRIRARGDVEVSGALLANGGGGWGWNAGGGAGGTVLVDCKRFSGAAGAALAANGGKSSGDSGGGGGGGRIAVWYGGSAGERARILAGNLSRVAVSEALDGFTGTLSVTNGVNNTRAGRVDPETGSALFLTVLPPGGTMIRIQ